MEIPSPPTNNWEHLAIDLKGPLPPTNNESILVIIDYKTRYPVAITIRSTTTQHVINCLEKTFSMFGYPRKIRSDNGPQFTSAEIEQYFKERNIHHERSSPYNPQGNGEVERFNRTLSKVIKCAITEQKDWKKELDHFLLMYRTTPHSITGVSPADMLLKHKPNNGIPSFEPTSAIENTSQEMEKKRKAKMYTDAARNAQHRDFEENEMVLVKRNKFKSKLDSFYEETPYRVERNHRNTVTLIDQKNRTTIRHKSHIKPYRYDFHYLNHPI
ncbi:uncharacterized protein K02A2.6-like [Hydractinia symbiolongicarpus]|uniref:uncharacterized protein K02A2.6-like n=1 Tax=Hydractinia symbiolongicarpus TaxID=13093 RepID=UPI00254D93B7|nr:uncharacterized protein K02A2.6-like [Hydractinia symbiolongicarpus]